MEREKEKGVKICLQEQEEEEETQQETIFKEKREHKFTGQRRNRQETHTMMTNECAINSTEGTETAKGNCCCNSYSFSLILSLSLSLFLLKNKIKPRKEIRKIDYHDLLTRCS